MDVRRNPTRCLERTQPVFHKQQQKAALLMLTQQEPNQICPAFQFSHHSLRPRVISFICPVRISPSRGHEVSRHEEQLKAS